MPDPLTRSLRYRERAAECLKLAAMAATQEIRAGYEDLAARYTDIAEVELKLADLANNAK